jgi:DNA mismatch endonuclease (patch repair protein)
MADVFSRVKRSAVMSQIRSRGNQRTEMVLISLFRANKIHGWRRHTKHKIQNPPEKCPLTVRPDFTFSQKRSLIFVDGCFWHLCPKHGHFPASRVPFWKRKLTRNAERDVLLNHALRKQGWRVLRIWEHELARKNETHLIKRIQRYLQG